MESGMLSDFFKTSMMLRGQPNITTEEYLQLVKQVKKAALRDMESFPENEYVRYGIFL